MKMNSWIIITDERRVGGMLNLVRALSGQVVAAVVGPRSLADSVAGIGFDRVLCFETAEEIPAEAYAAQLAAAAAADDAGLAVSSDIPVSRILLGAVAAKLSAVIVGSVRSMAAEGESIVISRSAAEGKVLEDIVTAGPAAVIFDGEDIDMPAAQAVPVEIIKAEDTGDALRLVETLEEESGSGLLTAERVVSVGACLISKDDLKLIEELAEAARAEIACSLPVCDDLRWLPTNRVVGHTHNQIAPTLYVAVGISGQPQHMAGVRDAKIVVAINNDPEARIFKNCNYGIVGDLYKIVPALIAAFKSAH